MTGRPRDERGAVAVFVAILSVVLLGAAAFTVDLGMQRVVRTDMQSTADTAALDMSRALANGTAPGSAAWTTALSTSLAGDTSTLGHSIAMPTGWTSATAVCNAKLCAQATPGYLDANSQFTPTAPSSATTYTAVKVTAAAAVNRGLANLLGSGDLGATRSAVATTTSNGCIQIGSYALGLQSGNSILLNTLVGNALQLQGIGYNGIATANVSLLGIAGQVGVGSVDALVSDSNLTVGQLVGAELGVLQSQTPQNTVAISALQALKAGLSPTAKAKVVAVSNVIDLGGSRSVADASVNALDLLFGSVQAMNGTNFLDTGLSFSRGNLAGVTARLKIIQKPQIACGSSVATSSQVTLELSGNLVGGVAGSFTADLNLASARATLDKVQCSGSVPSAATVNVVNDGLASATVHLSLLAGVVAADAGTSQPDSTSGSPFTLSLPAYYAPNWYPTANTTTPIPLLTSSDLSVLGILTLPLGSVLNAVDSLFVPQLNALITQTLEPILGLNFAGVSLDVLPTPTCGLPKLVG